MNVVSLLGTVVVALGSLVVVSLWLATYLTHLEMGKDRDVKWAWGTFKQFKTMFAQKEWKKEMYEKYQPSYFYNADYNNWYIHADIIIFNGVGMKLYPWSYVAFQVWSFLNREKGVSKWITYNWE